MEDSEAIEEARKKWKEIISDEEIRDRALRWEIAELDRNTALKHATEDGLRQGIEQATEQIIINMLENNVPIDKISEFTKIEIEKIKLIKDKIKKP